MNKRDTGRLQALPADWLAGGSEMGARMRAFDWSRTPLGPLETWPQSLRSAVSILLPSRAQIVLFWGRELITLYNDAYRPVFGAKHPRVLGLPAREAWSELWVAGLKDLLKGVVETGEAYWARDRLFVVERFGYAEETYFDVSYDPVRDESGQVGGVFCIVSETTARVVGARRLKTLRELAARTTEEAQSVAEACQTAARILAGNPHDLAFALIYTLDDDGGHAKTARLVGAAGLPEGSPAAPSLVDLAAPNDAADGQKTGWPLRAVLESGRDEVVTELERRLGALPSGVWPEPAHTAVVLPIRKSGQERLAGFLVAGVSPRLPLDDHYRDFLDLLANQIGAAVANARAFDEQRQRAEALAELDRAKTEFFSNVSHEFRTRLTLMLGPLEDLLAQSNGQHNHRDQLEVVHRNSLRLLKLVNTLLDFSRIEAGRIQAAYELVDLASYTAELASVFRAAIEKAGLQLIVDCPPLKQPVYVDREMWEKIVLNLLSNALKFTFKGEIAVSLKLVVPPLGGSPDEPREPAKAGTTNYVELRVRDTGTGIPKAELLHLFARFHQVRGARSRSHEGSGIGLALVQELTKLHGGSVRVESRVNRSTTFIVTIPTGTAHLPAERIRQAGTARALRRAGVRGDAYVAEAARWLPAEDAGTRRRGDAAMLENDSSHPADDDGEAALSSPRRRAPASPRPHILLADDNADMREYVRRLLSQDYEVVAVGDGAAALQAAREQSFDLLLTDVMMPQLDGFGLLKELRADERTRTLPVILLSARAGEESCVEGLEAGADDYLIKPFSARELRARVASRLEIARLRREADAATRASEKRMRVAMDAAEMYSWELDIATRRAVVSGNAAEVVGFPRDAAPLDVQRAIADVVHPDDRAGVAAVLERAMQTGEYHREVRLVHPATGQIIWIEAQATAVRDASGKPVKLIGVTQNITRRKQVEDAVRRGREQLQLVSDNVPALISYIDAERRYRWCNRAYTEWFGLPVEQVVGREMRDVLGAEAWQTISPHLEVALGGERVEYEAQAKYQTGGTRWIHAVYTPHRDDAGAVLGVVVMVHDLTERRQAEEALRASEEKYRTIFNSIDEGFCLVEVLLDDQGQPRDYRFLEINPVFAQLTGLENAVGKTARELVPNLEEFWIQTYGRVALTGEAARFENYAAPMNRWFNVHASRVGDETSRRVAIVFTNITARKAAEEKLRESEAHKEYLLKLSDALRPLADPLEIQQAAMRVVGEHLQVDRVLYSDVTPDGQTIIVNDNYVREGFAKMTGRFPATAFGAAIDKLRRGQPLVIADVSVETDLTEAEKAAYYGPQIYAVLGVPLVKEGRWLANFGFHQGEPRQWTNEEIMLLQETAERTWAAVERARSEQALREADLRLRDITDSTPVLIWQTDATGVTFVNRHYLEFFGVTFDAVKGMGWADFLHPDDAAGYVAAYQTAYARQEAYEYQCRFRRHDEEYRWLRNVGTPHLGAGGSFLGFIGSSTDITAIKEAEFNTRFLVDLDKRLGTLSEPEEIEQTTINLLGQFLRASHCYFAHIYDNERGVVAREYRAPEVSVSLIAEHLVTAYNPPNQIKQFLRGETVVNNDVVADAGTAALADNFALFQIRAFASTPIYFGGEWVGILNVTSHTPRVWREDELELLREVASRVWPLLERARAVAAVRVSEERYRGIVNQTLSGIAEVDLTGRFITVNDRYCEITGYTRAELMNLRMQDLTHAEDLPRNLALLEKLLTAGAPFEIEKRYVRSDGSPIWVYNSVSAIRDAAGAPQSVIAVSIDITERKQIEEELRESEERFRNMADHAPVMIWVTEADASCTYLSKSWYEFTGQTPETGLGLGWLDATHPDDRARAAQVFLAANEKHEAFRLDYRLRRADGSYAWAIDSAAPRFGPDGEFLGYIGSVLDITERKGMEEALKDADRRKDEFLAMLAHELRNPLAPITNAVHVLKLLDPAQPQLQWAQEIIERQTQYLTRLVDDLLDVSRITRGKVTLQHQALDVTTIINRAVETARPLVDAHRHQLSITMPAEPLRVAGDLTRLVQVVGNLLNNAAKYTNDGGRLQLEVTHEDGQVILRVRDNGVGLPAELLPQVFDLFTQAKRSLDRSQGGLGIGLTLVRSLVELHGGTVGAYSAGLGQGSEFTVRLPEFKPAPVAASTATDGAFARAASAPQLKILIVEDNVDAAESLAFLLRYKGHEVRIVHDGLTALTAAQDFQPQAILLDIGLPELDGYEIARRLRAQPDFQHTLLVALTGYGQEEDRRLAQDAGFDHHLTKPVEPTKLHAVLQKL